MKAKSGVLHRESSVTAEEEPREAKQEQDKGRHEPRFLAYVVMKVKPLRADGLLANHSLRATAPGLDPAKNGTGPGSQLVTSLKCAIAFCPMHVIKWLGDDLAGAS